MNVNALSLHKSANTKMFFSLTGIVRADGLVSGHQFPRRAFCLGLLILQTDFLCHVHVKFDVLILNMCLFQRVLHFVYMVKAFVSLLCSLLKKQKSLVILYRLG